MMNLLAFFSFSLLILFLSLPITTYAQPASAPVPSGPPNVTKILEKSRQFTIFLRLLRSTSVSNQINSQLNDSNNGLTVLAPADDAFSSIQAGTLNSLTDEQEIELVQFHVLPSFFSISQFQTVSNPVNTKAGDAAAYKFPLNVTTFGNQVNLTTGIVNTTVDKTIYTDGQLAVYQVDKVLLPYSIFGTPPPAAAPAPEAEGKNKKKKVVEADAGPSLTAGRLFTGCGMVVFTGVAMFTGSIL